eukprot:31497_1
MVLHIFTALADKEMARNGQFHIPFTNLRCCEFAHMWIEFVQVHSLYLSVNLMASMTQPQEARNTDMHINRSSKRDITSIDVQTNYSHHLRKQSNIPPRSRAQKGILYFQKSYYTKSQMTHIASKFKNHFDRAPRVVFSDNYRDHRRQAHQKRLTAGPQAKVVAP